MTLGRVGERKVVLADDGWIRDGGVLVGQKAVGVVWIGVGGAGGVCSAGSGWRVGEEWQGDTCSFHHRLEALHNLAYVP